MSTLRTSNTENPDVDRTIHVEPAASDMTIRPAAMDMTMRTVGHDDPDVQDTTGTISS